ncbi:hypothetical protein NA56DRAFT_752794 [Hyaloscypha hepaticicola]|uniref:Uncharacterized protein n=1 Tax=Hyaloscypha hepaticicola TaxID=2082293 RepID=A0A2J6PS07_9HELO|nr:hypothetical protein NA56DRAFT_752794 [Hyaloscypha hepaticicola]
MSSSKDLLASLNPYTTLKDKPGFADIYTLLALRSARFLSYKKAYMSDLSESDQSCGALVCDDSTPPRWCRLGTFSSPRRVWRAEIESRANAGSFSFIARSGLTQASGIAPLRLLKLLLDELHDQDIDSNSSSLARFTIHLGEIYLRVRRGKLRWTRWPFRLSQSLSDSLFGGGILLQMQARGLGISEDIRRGIG